MSRVNSTSNNPRQHPTDEILNKLAKHKLASGEVANVQLHVSKCRRCQTILDEFRVEESDFREGNDRVNKQRSGSGSSSESGSGFGAGSSWGD